MGHRGYGVQGYGPHGQWGTGVWGIWAMRPTGGMGYRGMGHMGDGAHMGDLLPKYQKDVKLSKKCQVVKKMSNVKNSNT